MARKNKARKQAAQKTRFYDRRKLLLELIPFALLLVMIVFAFYARPHLQDKVPIHWNAAGEVDNYGSKDVALFLIPGIYLIFLVLAFILPAADVFKENILAFYNYFLGMKILFGLFFVALYVVSLLPNFGYTFNMGTVVLTSILILFFIIGYIIRNVKRNFFIGIRTPWTLSDDTVWEKTHKLGGIIFMIFSVLMFILLFFVRIAFLFWIFIVGLILVALFLAIYSYVLYKELRNA